MINESGMIKTTMQKGSLKNCSTMQAPFLIKAMEPVVSSNALLRVCSVFFTSQHVIDIVVFRPLGNLFLFYGTIVVEKQQVPAGKLFEILRVVFYQLDVVDHKHI